MDSFRNSFLTEDATTLQYWLYSQLGICFFISVLEICCYSKSRQYPLVVVFFILVTSSSHSTPVPCIAVIKRYDDCCWYHYKVTITLTYLGFKLDRFFCCFLILGFFNKCFYKNMWEPVKFYNKDFVHLPFQNRSTKHQYTLCRNYTNNN